MGDLRLTGDEELAARVRATGALADGRDLVVHCVPQPDAALLRDLPVAGPQERLVVVCGERPAPWVIRALFRRCDGVIAAAELETTLAAAMVAVGSGLAVQPASYRAALDHPILSTREKQVLAMLVLGMPNIEIAAKLFVAESSVKAHLTSAFAKLGVRSRDEAAAIILDPDSGYGPGILRITEPDGDQR